MNSNCNDSNNGSIYTAYNNHTKHLPLSNCCLSLIFHGWQHLDFSKGEHIPYTYRLSVILVLLLHSALDFLQWSSCRGGVPTPCQLCNSPTTCTIQIYASSSICTSGEGRRTRGDMSDIERHIKSIERSITENCQDHSLNNIWINRSTSPIREDILHIPLTIGNENPYIPSPIREV